jgi:hypothetical protein
MSNSSNPIAVETHSRHSASVLLPARREMAWRVISALGR